jgi:3-deoxy-D-manno-octulosonic-acid transferase
VTFVYDLIFSLFGVFYFPFFLRRLAQVQNRKALIRQRLGFLEPGLRSRCLGKKTLWIHAVSVGEVYAATSFVEKLRAALPDFELVLSTVTPTGQAAAKKSFPDLAVFYFPFDWSGAVSRALDAVRPHLVVLMETEIWPNFLAAARKRRIPVILANGRLSPRSHARYRWARPWIEEVLEAVDFVLAQTDTDALRFRSLGIASDRIAVTGNMKFDVARAGSPEDAARALRERFPAEENERVMVAGSTHPGEEEILLEVYGKLRQKFAGLKMVMAPRHVTRAGSIAGMLEALPWRFGLASKTEAGRPLPDILILDTMGELAAWYSVARAVFMGGSLIRHGGQNPIEAALFGRPVVFGPHVFNFAWVYERLLESGAAVQVQDEEALYGVLTQWMEDDAEAENMGRRAFEVIRNFRGASARNAGFIARKVGEALEAEGEKACARV